MWPTTFTLLEPLVLPFVNIAMKQVPKLVQQLARQTRGKVLIVGSLTSEQRERSTYHAILQSAQRSGVPIVPYLPSIRLGDNDSPAGLIDHAIDGLAMARRTGCASVLVVGGGSTIDVAKNIATLLSSNVAAETLTNPATRDAILAEALHPTSSSPHTQTTPPTPTTPVIAVPTSFHGCVAASSTKTYATDAQEGAVIELSSDRLDLSGGVHVVVDPTLLATSSPMTCAEGAVSSLARLSDALLINEGGKDDIGEDGGVALGELLSTVKYLLDESFSLYDNRLPLMSNWVKTYEQEESIMEQYGAIGCVVGSCISLGGPGITQSMARVVASNYNVSFGQACAVLLPHICQIQMDRLNALGNEEAKRGVAVHVENVQFREQTMYQAFERIRSHVLLPKPSMDELKELTTSIMMDECFKQAVVEDNGGKTWTRKVVGALLDDSFEFLISEAEEEDAGEQAQKESV
jgi:alcohol dehydrogenase class IV